MQKGKLEVSSMTINQGMVITLKTSNKKKPYDVLSTSVFSIPTEEADKEKVLQHLKNHASPELFKISTDQTSVGIIKDNILVKDLEDMGLSLMPESSVELSIEKDTWMSKTFESITETSFLIKGKSIQKNDGVRLPLDANPRWPEHVSSLYDSIQQTAVEEPEHFQFRNNGMDIFAKSISLNESKDKVTITFGHTGHNDGLANGAFTYYTVSSMENIVDSLLIKMRVIVINPELMDSNDIKKFKEKTAGTKNLNRKLAGSDSANFFGFYEWMKNQLKADKNLVKWMTGEQGLTNKAMSIDHYVRLISSLQMNSDRYHHILSKTKSQQDLNKSKTLLTSTGSWNKNFIDHMNKGDE